MLAQLTASTAVPKTLKAAHLQVLMPKSKTMPREVPYRELLSAELKRRGIKGGEFASTPVAAKVAAIKQCTLDGEADHILAARFLKRFPENDVQWLHVDLSSTRCEGGPGSVASDVTGFGVGWGWGMLQDSKL